MIEGYESLLSDLTGQADKIMKKVTADVGNLDMSKVSDEQANEIRSGLKQVDAAMAEMPDAISKAMEAIKQKR